jgi:transposase
VYFKFRPHNPKQGYLLPPSLDDWLPEDHLARSISDAVDSMDLSGFCRFYCANEQVMPRTIR